MTEHAPRVLLIKHRADKEARVHRALQVSFRLREVRVERVSKGSHQLRGVRVRRVLQDTHLQRVVVRVQNVPRGSRPQAGGSAFRVL